MATNNIRTSGGIFTHHFVESLLQDTLNHPAMNVQTFAFPRQEKFSEKELETKISTAWEALIERWDAVEREFGALDISALRQRWLRPLFFYLNIEPEFQRADIVLESDLRFPISHIGRMGTTEFTVPVHSVLYDKESKSDTLETRVGTGGGIKKIAPHDMVQRYLNLSKEHDWALLTDGVYLRLLRDFHHTYTRGYIEFDLQGIFNSRDFAGFRAMYRLLHASRFVIDAEKEVAPIDQLYEDALAMGVKVGEDLRKNVQAAIESLANGFLVSSPGFIDQVNQQADGPAQLYRDVLMTIYRMLFLLFAEQRGMLPGRGSLYMEAFSLTAFRTLAEQPPSEDRNLDLWEQIKTTFSMVEHGVEELDIFAYNGALFSLNRTPLLTPDDPDLAPRCRNDYFLRTVRHLTVVEKDKVLQRISYSDLSVEEIGSIYESLLEFTPQISESQIEIEGRLIPANTFFLDPRGTGRKTTGSYYTPPSLVNELIKSALVPVMEDRIKAVVPDYDPELVEALNDEERQAAEEAILAINVVDPAAGSGAFLIAANNKLALELARIRSGEYFPPEATIRYARRDVLAHCIYAVDLNPMAVELCKVSLWINAAVEDAPLNFLDHHIKFGNSLVGATPDLIAGGIPNDAYNPVTGDDKNIAKAIKTQNREELKGQISLMKVSVLETKEDLRKWAEIDRLAEADPNQAEAEYLAYWGGGEYLEKRLPYDLWTAAFFAHLTEDSLVPTTQDVRQAKLSPAGISQEIKKFVLHLDKHYHFFHYHLEFPQIFDENGNGGFDVVLSNPPWERVKLQDNEFFGDQDDSISKASNAASRKRLIAKLPETNPVLWAKYKIALRDSEATSKFLRDSGSYPLTGRGDVNTYQVFAGKNRGLIGKGGRAGFIVPTGIATDYTSKEFFADLILSRQLASLYDFENRKGLFPSVHRSYKFCLLTLQGKGNSTQNDIEFAFFLHSTNDLTDYKKRFTLTSDDFARINPNTLTCPVFRTRREANITIKIYKNFPVWVHEETHENPWEVNFLRMVDPFSGKWNLIPVDNLSSDSTFYGRYQHESEQYYLPLYEGKMIFQYDHRLASVVMTDNITRPAQADLVESFEKADASFSVTPRGWIAEDNILKELKEQGWNRRWLMVQKKVTSPTNERTHIASIIPLSGTSESLHGILFGQKYKVEYACALLANLNSYAFDFVTRQKLGGVNFNYFVLQQLPVISPSQYTSSLLSFIFPRVLELTYTSWDLVTFADDAWEECSQDLREIVKKQWEINEEKTNGGNLAIQSPEWVKFLNPKPSDDPFPYHPFRWDEDRRFKLRCELDALYGHLYGLTRDEFNYILETFPIVKRKDEVKYGEYRTKHVILDNFDNLADNSILEGVSVPLNERVSVLEYPEKSQPQSPKAASKPPIIRDDIQSYTMQESTPRESVKKKTPKSKTTPENQQSLFDASTDFSAEQSDYGLYRCQKCGNSLMGFSLDEHTNDKHGGKNPGYEKNTVM